jgi:hypothetical protein
LQKSELVALASWCVEVVNQHVGEARTLKQNSVENAASILKEVMEARASAVAAAARAGSAENSEVATRFALAAVRAVRRSAAVLDQTEAVDKELKKRLASE